MKKVLIIGGGIAGLATAYYLQERGRGLVECALAEGSRQVGGKIRSSIENGFIVEGGPDSFSTQNRAALRLCHALGLESDLIPLNREKHNLFAWSHGHLCQMPEGLMLMLPTRWLPFLRSHLISWPGKLRMALEPLIPPRTSDDDESLSQFVRRRLGGEALEKIAAPLMAGIHVADPDALSLKSTFPRFSAMEQQYGSLLRGMAAQKRAAAKKKTDIPAPAALITLRYGLQQFAEAIAARLEDTELLLGRSAVAATPVRDGYAVKLSDGSQFIADELVFATPTHVTADILEGVDPVTAHALRQIRYVSSATVSLGFPRAEVEHALDGFGFVVPRTEKRKIIACTWSSTKFPNRAPAGSVLLRAFLAGTAAEQDEGTLKETVRDELRAMMGITADPTLAMVYRWRKANPQYEVGHQARVAEIERRIGSQPGLHLTGSAYHGAGIPDCIEGGARVASEIIAAAQTECARARELEETVFSLIGGRA